MFFLFHTYNGKIIIKAMCLQLGIPKSIPKLEWNEDIDVCASTLEMAHGHAISAADREAWLLHHREVIEVKAVEAPSNYHDGGDNHASGSGGGGGDGGPLPANSFSLSPFMSSSSPTDVDSKMIVASPNVAGKAQQRWRLGWRQTQRLPSAFGRHASDFGRGAWRGVVGGSVQSDGSRSRRGWGGMGGRGGKVVIFKGAH